MAKYTGPQCRLCRREGTKLFLKGDRCNGDKCAFDRRGYRPGQHGQSHRGGGKRSDYCRQLREKQKVKTLYGLLEGQFRRCFELAARKPGITGENLLFLLERRLDNAVYRLGFCVNRNEARQLVRHNHFLLNGKKVNIPSLLVRPGDVVSVREGSRNLERVKEALESASQRAIPNWLELDRDNFKGTVKASPAREDIAMPIEEQLIVELYSK